MSDDDDDEPMLSASSLAALQEFLSDEKERDEKVQPQSGYNIHQFNENWVITGSTKIASPILTSDFFSN
jgi:hypothetical protein